MKQGILILSLLCITQALVAAPIDYLPPTPPPEKKIADYTAQDIVGCVFGRNRAQPKEHPLRVKDPWAKLKAEWPGAKVATNIDLVTIHPARRNACVR